MPGKDPAKGARDTGRTGRGIGEGPGPRDRGGAAGQTNVNGKLSYSDPSLEAARQAAYNSPKGAVTRSMDTFSNQRDFHSAAADAQDDGMLGLFDLLSPITELDPWKGYWSPGQKRASYGLNPASVIGGAVGMGLGVPGLGTLAGKAYSLADGPMVDVGPDVFKGDSLGPNLRDVNSLSNGGWSGGGLGLGGQPGASPDSNHDGKTGINSGLLGLGVTSPVPAQSQLNQSNAPAQAQQAPGWNSINHLGSYYGIGGPSPYGVTFNPYTYPTWR